MILVIIHSGCHHSHIIYAEEIFEIKYVEKSFWYHSHDTMRHCIWISLLRVNPKTNYYLTNRYYVTVSNWHICEIHDDVIKWEHFPRYWPFLRGIHRSPVNSPHKGQWRGALMYSLICVWINGWVNNREAGDTRRYRARYDIIVMSTS